MEQHQNDKRLSGLKHAGGIYWNLASQYRRQGNQKKADEYENLFVDIVMKIKDLENET